MPNPGGLGPAELPDWAPLTWNVADYVPHRTLATSVVSNTQGEDVYRLTFDDTTRPSGDAVSRLIADACDWVASRIAPMHELSQAASRVVATLLSAAAVERGWPADGSSLQRALDFEKRADLMLTGLVASNDAAWADDDQNPATPERPLSPVFSFPAADPRWDSPAYW